MNFPCGQSGTFESGPDLEPLASIRTSTPLARFPPSRRVSEKVHSCGCGIYLLSNPSWAEHPDQVWAVGWAESDYWADRAFTVFYGDLEPPPRRWDQVPSLEFLGKPEDLSFGSVRAFEQAQEGARKAALVSARYRIMTDGAFLNVVVKGIDGVTYSYASNNPKAKDLPVAIEVRLPGEPAEEVVIYRRPGAPPLD